MGSSLRNLSKLVNSIVKKRPKRTAYQYFWILTVFLAITITNNTKSANVELKNISGAQISGLLVKKSETQIEVQTKHGTLILKEKDLVPKSWNKAQNTITSRPLPIGDDTPMPPPKPTKKIDISYQPQEDIPTPTTFTGFTEPIDLNEQEITPNPKITTKKAKTKEIKELFSSKPPSPSSPSSSSSPSSPSNPSNSSKDIIDTNYFSVIPLINNQSDTSDNNSIKTENSYPIRNIVFPVSILGICIILLYNSKTQRRIKLSGYLILAILSLSIALQNSTLGIVAIGLLCIFMLSFEYLESRKLAVKQALGLVKEEKKSPEIEQTPSLKTLKINPNHLNKLEWKRFEDFCRVWLEHNGFEITKIKPHSKLSQKVIEGFCPPIDNVTKGKKFKALYINWDRPAGIIEIKAVRKLCTSTQTPILISNAGFEKDAIEWAKDDKVRIIGNKELIEKFKTFPKEIKEKIIKSIWDNGHDIPTCPVCNLKMIKIEEENTPKFWFCKEYIKCHQRVKIPEQAPQTIKEDKIYPDFSIESE